jgi:hypothetical protein
MGTSKKQISEWVDKGCVDGYNFMIIVCDSFDYEDFPVYTTWDRFHKDHAEHNSKSMQKIMEIYDLNMDKKEQLNANRVFNYPKNQPNPKSKLLEWLKNKDR